MTRPKFRPCEFCQTPNQANRKTCTACFKSLSTKKKLKEKVQLLDSQWGQAVIKNRNASRILDSARIAVQKLEAIGYKPILFVGKKEKVSNKWVADIITHLELSSTSRQFLEKMQRAYEFLLTKEQAETLNEEQPDVFAGERQEMVAAEERQEEREVMVAAEGERQEMVAEGEEGERQEMVAEGERQEMVAEGERQEMFAEGERQEMVAEGERQEMFAEGERQEMVAEGERQEMFAEGERQEMFVEGERQEMFVEGERQEMVAAGELQEERQEMATFSKEHPKIPSNELEETIVLELVPFSPPVVRSMRKKRQSSTSPTSTTSQLPVTDPLSLHSNIKKKKKKKVNNV